MKKWTQEQSEHVPQFATRCAIVANHFFLFFPESLHTILCEMCCVETGCNISILTVRFPEQFRNSKTVAKFEIDWKVFKLTSKFGTFCWHMAVVLWWICHEWNTSPGYYRQDRGKLVTELRHDTLVMRVSSVNLTVGTFDAKLYGRTIMLRGHFAARGIVCFMFIVFFWKNIFGHIYQSNRVQHNTDLVKVIF